MKKFLKWGAIVLGGLIGLGLLASVALYPIGMEKLNRSFPNIAVETVKIPDDPDAVAHGRHVAIIWGCIKCHGGNLGGTLLGDDPFLGTIAASNLTLGKGGIANVYTDADWIRAIRHGVKPNSRGEIFMYDYSTMSDRDLGDLIAYLKQTPPVDADYSPTSFGPLVAIARAVGLFTPMAEKMDHTAPHPDDPVPGATTEYGKYLAGICLQCHSKNLSGKLEEWTRAEFVIALRNGVLPNGKRIGPAMSVKIYGELNDMELDALWLYFQNLPNVTVRK